MATLLLAEKAVDLKIKLDADRCRRPAIRTGGGADPEAGRTWRRGGPGGGGQRGGLGGYWTKPSFRLAIVCVEYPDVKHNPKITNEAWDEALFSEGTYNKTNATGQAVHGSFRDYFLEQSYGYFKVEGKVFDWIEVSKKRPEYATGNRTALLTESLDKLLARDGKDALKDFDGVFFLYAGGTLPGPSRQPVLAAPGVGQPQGEALAVLHRRGGRAADAGPERPLPRVRPHARPARPLRPPREPRHGGRWGSGAACRSSRTG